MNIVHVSHEFKYIHNCAIFACLFIFYALHWNAIAWAFFALSLYLLLCVKKRAQTHTTKQLKDFTSHLYVMMSGCNHILTERKRENNIRWMRKRRRRWWWWRRKKKETEQRQTTIGDTLVITFYTMSHKREIFTREILNQTCIHIHCVRARKFANSLNSMKLHSSVYFQRDPTFDKQCAWIWAHIFPIN